MEKKQTSKYLENYKTYEIKFTMYYLKFHETQ